jgi:fructokinase
MARKPLVGSVEAGGTKFVCGLGTGPDDVREHERFPTTDDPEETLGRTVERFRSWQRKHGPLAALGVGAFGPVDPDPDSPGYGTITTTPKPGWQDVDVRGFLARELDLPVAFDTDVNAAALGEWRWGAARGLHTFYYLTVGTGIGGGGMAAGQLMHGLVHPEVGHLRIPHDRDTDPFEGVCPYHGDCLEGLACGPALEKRWGADPRDLAEEHRAWELEADHLAAGLVNLILALSPQRLILGGGVMRQSHLFPRIRRRVQRLLGGYLRHPRLQEEVDELIVPPQLGSRAGLLGGIALAQRLRRG